ncbi:MAG: pSer/pThr/pTyr-binding forkhead associated (FHA) protein [Saprospiraceae bacterium]|jgi:pSer/pThr/pTyr-binding forkhead associated (FHA) protein
MKKLFRIGKGRGNDIVIRDKDCSDLHAEIACERGSWVLTNLEQSKAILVNDDIIQSPIKLAKNNRIRICDQTIYWSNFLCEGENQELKLIDFISFNT